MYIAVRALALWCPQRYTHLAPRSIAYELVLIFTMQASTTSVTVFDLCPVSMWITTCCVLTELHQYIDITLREGSIHFVCDFQSTVPIVSLSHGPYASWVFPVLSRKKSILLFYSSSISVCIDHVPCSYTAFSRISNLFLLHFENSHIRRLVPFKLYNTHSNEEMQSQYSMLVLHRSALLHLFMSIVRM